VELHFIVVFVEMQAIEIGTAIDAQQHGFAVDDERRIAVKERGRGDQREAPGPVMAVAGP